jgi:predicted nucleotidyltransferase
MIEFYGGYQVYSESGVDLTLLRQNLELSTTQRLLHNAQASRALEAFAAEARAGSNAFVQERGVKSPMLDIESILRQLKREQVEFVIIGGQAMIAHGSAYITKDVDICYSRTLQNTSRLAAALEPIHPYLRGVPKGLPFRFDAATIRAGLNFTLDTDLGPIDVLGEVSGIGGYEEALSLAIEKTAFGTKVHVLSIDGLIISKIAAGRNKDKLHILELEELKKMSPDKS